jgi:uncharacterized protein YjiS (DUF1127 family)
MTSLSNSRRLPTHRFGFKGLLRRIFLANAAWRQRRALEQLDDTLLHDIGRSRDEAQAEAKRPIWDVPGHWLR